MLRDVYEPDGFEELIVARRRNFKSLDTLVSDDDVIQLPKIDNG